MKKSFACLLILALVFSFAGCSGKQSGDYTADKVIMTYVASPLNVPSILEKEHGDYAAAFQKLGLGFGYSDLDSGADQTAALASGDIHILNGVGGSSAILAAANGCDLVILSMYSTAPKAFAMYTSDPSLTSPQSLKGKTVAGPKGTNLHELLVAYLATADMTVNDVHFVSMDIPSSAAALENGSIDVALLGGPAAYQCEQSGKHKITDGEGLIAATIVTAASRKFAEQNPKIIETFLNTQKKLVEKMLDDLDNSLQTAAEALGLDRKAVAEMYAMYDFDPALTEEDIAAIQSTEKFLCQNSMTEQHVDIHDIVYKGFYYRELSN